jgi:hypothetical protein
MVLTRVAQGVTRWSLPRVEGIWESTGGRTLPAPGQEACPLETDPASWIVDSKYAFAADVKWAVIARHYHTRDERRVAAFAFDRPRLLNALLDAYPRLSALFGHEASLELRLRTDPEIPSRRYLAVFVATGIPVKEALRRMDRFDADWWLDRVGELGQELLFTLDFA